jgi:uncharacterized protein (DUF2147 family)
MRGDFRPARRPVRHILCGAVLAVLLALRAQVAGADPSLTGIWLTGNDTAQVEISDCAGKLCGTIISLREPLDEAGQPKTDKRNRDASLRARPIMGLPILLNFVRLGPKRWGEGTIYNPEDGDTYKCTLSLDEPDTLTVRGYVGIPLFGKTQIWHRVAE